MKYLHVLALASTLAACSTAPQEETGSASVAITTVPADVLCIRLKAVGTRTVDRDFDVAPGASSTLVMPSLPAGAVTFSGVAFESACTAVTSGEVPSWVSEPVAATVPSKGVADVSLEMRRNRKGSVSVDFVDDDADAGTPDTDPPPPPPPTPSECDVVTQVRLSDGAPACGSPDPTNPTIGCYIVDYTTFRTICSNVPSGAETLTHGAVALAAGTGGAYLNGCAPGYVPLLRNEAQQTECVATCTPSPTSFETPTNVGGLAPHTCAARGAPSAGCRYFNMLAMTSPNVTGNTTGFCLDPDGLFYDHDQDSTTPDEPLASCTTVTSNDMNGDGISDNVFYGCAPTPLTPN